MKKWIIGIVVLAVLIVGFKIAQIEGAKQYEEYLEQVEKVIAEEEAMKQEIEDKLVKARSKWEKEYAEEQKLNEETDFIVYAVLSHDRGKIELQVMDYDRLQKQDLKTHDGFDFKLEGVNQSIFLPREELEKREIKVKKNDKIGIRYEKGSRDTIVDIEIVHQK